MQCLSLRHRLLQSPAIVNPHQTLRFCLASPTCDWHITGQINPSLILSHSLLFLALPSWANHVAALVLPRPRSTGDPWITKTLRNMSRPYYLLAAPALPRVILLMFVTLSIFGAFTSAIPPLKHALPATTAPGPIPTQAPAPPVPSVEECKAHITTPPTDRSLFYSLGTVDSAKNFSLIHVPRLYILADRLDNISDYANSPNSPWSQAEKDLFWDNCSEAFAQLTSGVAFVILPSVIPATPEVWKRIEYDALVSNMDVDMIVKVIAENLADQTILWPCSRGGTQYSCPDNVPFTGDTTPM